MRKNIYSPELLEKALQSLLKKDGPGTYTFPQLFKGQKFSLLPESTPEWVMGKSQAVILIIWDPLPSQRARLVFRSGSLQSLVRDTFHIHY